MFNILSDDILTYCTMYWTVPEMFALFCANKENAERSQNILNRRYRTYSVERHTLHRFYHAVTAMIENWRLEKERKISIPMYNNNRRLRTEETPVLMF